MTEYTIADEEELEEEGRIITQLEGQEIGVFKIDGELLAYTNWCAHQSGPICEGKIGGTTSASFDRDSLETKLEWVKDGKVMRCPWHDWEYDVSTGECLSKRGIRLPSHEIHVEDGEIVVTL